MCQAGEAALGGGWGAREAQGRHARSVPAPAHAIGRDLKLYYGEWSLTHEDTFTLRTAAEGEQHRPHLTLAKGHGEPRLEVAVAAEVEEGRRLASSRDHSSTIARFARLTVRKSTLCAQGDFAASRQVRYTCGAPVQGCSFVVTPRCSKMAAIVAHATS